MAISFKLAKENLSKLSNEELENKLNNINMNKLNKNLFIKDLVDNFLNVSYKANECSYALACEELLKERTGKSYNIKDSSFYELKYEYEARKEHANRLGFNLEKDDEKLVKFNDILEYILSDFEDPFWAVKVREFFTKLRDKDEEQKIFFIICLNYNSEDFNNFSKCLLSEYNADELFNEYYNKCKEYFNINNIKA